ncbi:CapA family protein [Aquisalibacillus elongatus]|uniref:Poly-gamma-glutamate synthesis protein (Capsule biosynthesis protein) n=1 Tax=Aquisalibacillus elongatus TaxID=485577 RepID=A0A3N5CF20_9BACI|nr:CapA family protein [Aquisalibacillus elongatus]RPF55881.1 poly-gamma-glutamate synthesis protein (capsule biosynthesis protein) [Aquisalibacillus elongatus]
MKKKLWIIISSIVALSIVLVFNYNNHTNSESKPVQFNSTINVDHYNEVKTFETSIKLNAIGDLIIHEAVYQDAETSTGYDFDPMFQDIKYYLRNADITIANQETILGGDELDFSSYPTFNTPQVLANTLKNSGIDILSMANNHTLDRGEAGVMSATQYLNEIELDYVGAYQSENDRNKHRVIHRKGIAVGFLSYTYGTNGVAVPEGKDYLVNLIDEDQILKDLEELKPKTDFIVVNMHFGQEYQSLPSEEQIHLSELLANNGADVILGHHPHILQPVDWISKGQGKESFVAYSLGNFLSAQIDRDRSIGAIMQIQLTKEIDENQEINLDVSDAKIMPTYNQYENFKNFKITPLVEVSEQHLSDAKHWFKQKKDHIQSFTKRVEVVPYLE